MSTRPWFPAFYIHQKVIGRRLQKLREERNDSLAKVARIIGISMRNLEKIEEGEVDFLLTTIDGLSRYYNIPLHDLFAKEGPSEG